MCNTHTVPDNFSKFLQLEEDFALTRNSTTGARWGRAPAKAEAQSPETYFNIICFCTDSATCSFKIVLKLEMRGKA